MRPRSPRQRQGSILILVLWITLGLIAVALLYGHASVLELRAAEARTAAWQAEQAIDAGLRYAIRLIKDQEHQGALPVLEERQSGPVELGDSTFWFLGRASIPAYTDRPAFGLQDELARLNINTATLEMLEALPGMTPQLAAAIVDWRDEDDEPEENGAESRTYLQRDPPYPAKNAPFDSIEELRLLEGADPYLLDGEDYNRNGLLDPNEDDGDLSWPPDDGDGELRPGILEHVTVHAAPADDDRIDINGEDGELEELLKETFGEERASDFDIPDSDDVGVSPLVFFIMRNYIFSGDMTPEEFAQIENRLKAGPGEDGDSVSPVNLNTASEEVLACLPWFGPEGAAVLVTHRESKPPGSPSLAWLLDLDGEEGLAMEQENLELEGPEEEDLRYMAGSTTLYRIDIAATGRHGRGYRRVRFVVETSGDEPRILSRAALPRAGWALGTGPRAELSERVASGRSAW